MAKKTKAGYFVVLTREDGTDCWRGTTKFEVGKITETPGWNLTSVYEDGIHLGDARTVLFYSVAARRAFLVEPVGETFGIKPGIYKSRKARAVKVVKEISFPRMLAKLATDKSKGFLIRMDVARNVCTPAKTFITLSRDEHMWVREEVARSHHAPIKALAVLSRDRSWKVRMQVARNPRTPIRILQRLERKDTERYSRVREMAGLCTYFSKQKH